MAGTAMNLQTTASTGTGTSTSTTKRKRDADIEPDTRQQTCLSCTLSWPWVKFPSNPDGSRKIDERKCYHCSGLGSAQWNWTETQMNNCIAKARSKILDDNSGSGYGNVEGSFTPSITPTTANTNQRQATMIPSATASTTTQAVNTIQTIPVTAQFSNSQAGSSTHQRPQAQPHPQSQSRSYPNPPPPPTRQRPQHQYQYQNQNQGSAQYYPDHQFHGMNQHQFPQYQYQNLNQHPIQHQDGQAPMNLNQAFAYNNGLPPSQPFMHHQPLPQVQAQDPWIRLFSYPEPSRAVQWVYAHYNPGPGATPIAQTELFRQYVTSIPSRGYPPLLGGKDFITTVAKHFEGFGVKLDRTDFTIWGLWRRDQPVFLI